MQLFYLLFFSKISLKHLYNIKDARQVLDQPSIGRNLGESRFLCSVIVEQGKLIFSCFISSSTFETKIVFLQGANRNIQAPDGKSLSESTENEEIKALLKQIIQQMKINHAQISNSQATNKKFIFMTTRYVFFFFYKSYRLSFSKYSLSIVEKYIILFFSHIKSEILLFFSFFCIIIYFSTKRFF